MTEKFTNIERGDILDEDIGALRAKIKMEKEKQKALRGQADDLDLCIDRLEIRERALCIGRDKLANL